MRSTKQIFHLAIPCHDLALAKQYYGDLLGCEIARVKPDRVTLNFFGDQVVCHLAPEEIDQNPQMYPRHFGVTFSEKQDFEALLRMAKEKELRFFQDVFVRFEGQPDEHRSFVLIDFSNNLLEFKYYNDPAMMY